MMQKRVHLLAVVAALAACAAFADVDLSDGLVTWFSFDGASSDGVVENLADADRPLTLVSGAGLDSDDAVGGCALSFPGVEGQAAKFTSPALTNCTVAFWFRRGEDDGPYVETNSVALPYIMSSWSAIRCHISHANSSLAFIGINNTPIAALDRLAPHAVWMHYVVSFEEISREDGKSTVEAKVYLRGSLFSTLTNTVDGVQGGSKPTTTWLGNYTDGTRPLMFRMDEFRAWSRALSEQEARAEYLRTSEAAPSSLVAYWNMDDITTVSGSPVVLDGSGLGHTLALGTAVTVTNDAVEGNALSFVSESSSWGRTTFNVPMSDATFAVWIRPDADSEATSPRLVEGFGGYVHASPGRREYALTIKPPYASSSFTLSGRDEPWCLDKGQWTHFALTRGVNRLDDGSYTCDIAIYVNGVKTAERTDIAITAPFFANDAKLHFFSNGSSRPIDALGDEMRFYSGVLSAERIAKLYAGAANVSAGSDFTVTSGTATLRGRVCADAEDPMRSGYDGAVSWALVSAPEGGEGSVIATPSSPETEVTLPVEGKYVFSLSVTAEGFSRSNTVTVVRASSASGSAPVVSATAQASVTLPLKGWIRSGVSGAERVWWHKVSGPGGVWFDVDGDGDGCASFSAAGTYVLSCTAANAAGSASSSVSVSVAAGEIVDLPTDGLQLHFAFNTNQVWKESVRGTDFSSKLTQFGGTAAELVPGLKTLGFRILGGQSSLKVSSTWETKASGNLITTPEYLTFSAWMKYEPDSDENDSELPFVMVNFNSCCLRMGRAEGKASTGIVDAGEGMTMCQQNGGGPSMSGLTCDFAGMPSITGRWTHVCAVFPRTGGDKDSFELWIDGVKRTLTPVANYATFPRVGRDTSSGWDVGGYAALQTANYNLMANATNRVDGGYKSTTFPGALDEVRFYSAKLSDAQIRALANERDAMRNLAPVFDTPSAAQVLVREELPISLGVYDDGLPAGGTLSCCWKVLSGDASAVSFSDASSASTTVSFGSCGNYMLQLVATDGERISYSEPLSVDVLARGSVLIFR